MWYCGTFHTTTMFGEFVRNIRIKNEIGLRQFCLDHKHDPSNWSKIERGELPPPSDDAILGKWALQLGIKKDSKDWYTFFDLAAVSKGELPTYVKSNAELLRELPVFFRTLSGQKPNEMELRRLAKLLKGTTKPKNARSKKI